MLCRQRRCRWPDTIRRRIGSWWSWRGGCDGHQGPIWHATFSRDGKVIAIASADQTVRLWTLWAKDWPQLIELLRQQTNACLTAQHRQRFLAEPAAQARQRYKACETSYGRVPEPAGDLSAPETN